MNLFNKIGKFVYRVLHPKEVKSASLKETLIKGKEKIVRDNDFKKLNDYNSEFILEDDLSVISKKVSWLSINDS